MSIIGSNILAGASGQGGGYTIESSLRFRSSASAYLSRTPASAGNRKTWTYSLWTKLGNNSNNQRLFGSHLSANDLFGCYITTGGQLVVWSNISGAASLRWNSNALLRDYSAWYHLVFVLDTTQSTSTNRFKVYLNNEQLTTSSYTAPAQNSQQYWNSTSAMWIGRSQYAGYFDGYLTEVNFIDGQALTPSDFGEYNEDTGVWQPVKYSGSYGTNGFYLPFSDNTNTTTLVADASGNGNDWTPNNISLTSGATYDSMTDTPTPYADGGNYAVLNPTFAMSGVTTGATIIDGNLKKTTGTDAYAVSSFALSTGSWYWEISIENAAPGNIYCGLLDIDSATLAQWRHTGTTLGTTSTPTIATYTLGDTLSFAYDADNNRIYYAKNGVWQNSADPSAGSGFLTPNTSVAKYPFGRSQATQYLAFNFGQRPFAYTPPTGFLPLHTGNLPDSAVVNGSQYFNINIWTGNGTGQTITTTMKPEFVWIKSRNQTYDNQVWDILRGPLNKLATNQTAAESSLANSVTAFNASSYTLGDTATVNLNTGTFVGWAWKANGAGVSNTDGSITSTVSASPTAGFSIVTYTGNGSAGATVGHGLGAAPKMVFYKQRSTTGNWLCMQNITGSMQYAYLNLTNAFAAATQSAPTSSILNFGSGGTENTNAVTVVAYCFAEVEGYSKFGSYTGNGSADGPFVYLGFRPKFVMVKRTDSTSSWQMWDATRSAYNAVTNGLRADLSNAEYTSGLDSDFLSNGFKLRSTGINLSGGTYIYMAFAEVPMKYSLGR
jgi:hypothetical protein